MRNIFVRSPGRLHPYFVVALALTVAGCDRAREGLESHRDVVARVDGYALSVERAAALLAETSEEVAPANPRVVDPFIDHWINHVLLASSYAQPDSFESIDVTPLIQLMLDQELVWQLHRDVIAPRAELGDEELRQVYERERPWTRTRGAHILIQVPESADREERDRLRARAEELRERIASGADFAELARRHSDDPASAAEGGDLGWIERGQLLPELESVLLELPVDSISDVVPTRLGFHIVRVTERASPAFEEVRAEYRNEIADRRTQEVENAYIDSLFEAADLRFRPGAISLARNLAASPRIERLPSAERDAYVARFRGGELTVGDLADFIMRTAPNGKRAFSGDSARIQLILRELVRNRLLVNAAERHGYETDPEWADSVAGRMLRDVRMVAVRAGYDRSRLRSTGSTLLAQVDSVVLGMIRNDRTPVPLERVAVALRKGRTVQVYPERFPEVARRVAEIRREGGDRTAVERGGPRGDPADPAGTIELDVRSR